MTLIRTILTSFLLSDVGNCVQFRQLMVSGIKGGVCTMARQFQKLYPRSQFSGEWAICLSQTRPLVQTQVKTLEHPLIHEDLPLESSNYMTRLNPSLSFLPR